MKRVKRNKFTGIRHLAVLLLCSLLFSGCNDDLDEQEESLGNGGHLTIPITLATSPIVETKAVTRPVQPGSEAEKLGFHYDIQVTSSDTLAPATKAATKLKLITALLFGETTGKIKGTATLTEATAGSPAVFNFTLNGNTGDTSYRLVVVAVNYASTLTACEGYLVGKVVNLSQFTGTYAEFLKLNLSQLVTADIDVPYVGSITGVSLTAGSDLPVLPLYRMLAKITVKLASFSIKNGPKPYEMWIYRYGNRYIGTPYDYSGKTNTVTDPERISNSTQNFSLTGESSYYLGENIQHYDVTSATDRCPTSAPNAPYLCLQTEGMSVVSSKPAVGEELITGGAFSLWYYIMLGDGNVSDFSLRRNTNYYITITIDGTLEGQRRQALTDNRILVSSTEIHAGLNIGRFGGAEGFTTGTGAANTITGSYTKDLLLQPNTAGGALDTVARVWSNSLTRLQLDNRKGWDPTYTNSNIDDAANLAYSYCKNLTIGGYKDWYLPTNAQLAAIRTILRGVKTDGKYANYSKFNSNNYWSSTEGSTTSSAIYVLMSGGHMNTNEKTGSNSIRCVRDI